MKLEEVLKKLKYLRTDRRYDIFIDYENSDPENDKLVHMILEHNPYQPIKELRRQGLWYIGFVVDSYLHINKKLYSVEGFRD